MKYLINKLGNLLFASIILFLFAISASGFEYELFPESILSQIEKKGATQVVQDLYDDGKAWSIVLQQIGTGKPEWINVANKLRPGTDAGSSSMLDVAMFIALENSPALVLETCNFDLEFVCSANFLIDYPLNEEALKMIERRKISLSKITDSSLYVKRDSCITGLVKAAEYVEMELKKRNKLGAGLD